MEERVPGTALPVSLRNGLVADHGPEMASLLTRCCAHNSLERPSFKEVRGESKLPPQTCAHNYTHQSVQVKCHTPIQYTRLS